MCPLVSNSPSLLSRVGSNQLSEIDRGHSHLICLFREPPYSHLEDRDVPDLGIMLAQPRSEAAVAQQTEPASSAVALHWPEAQPPLQTLAQLLPHSVQ